MDHDPGAAIRRTLQAAWREVLQTDGFGIDDNFFDLGGTSLEAVVVVSRLNLELGTDISGIGLFERPTIRAMTDLLLATAQPGPSGSSSSAGPAAAARRRGQLRRTIGPVRRRPRDDQ
jgi:hypothetical protein